MSATNFLDVTFDLHTGKYFPYRKPNSKPLYINALSNHPPTILKQLPEIINQRLIDLSYNKEEFDKAKSSYEIALEESDHKKGLNTTNATQKDGIETEKEALYDITLHIIGMLIRTFEKRFYNWYESTSPKTTNCIKSLTPIQSSSVIPAPQTCKAS